MASGVVYEGVTQQQDGNETEVSQRAPKLFSGLKLWFSATVPLRSWLIENAKANGAEIVPLDRQADIRLVDHARRLNAPGTHSYTFIEQSIKKGIREDLTAHRVGVTASVDRPVGSIVTGPKGTRTPFTEEEDQFLWNAIKPLEARGGSVAGNEVYKQIARLRPRHTFQSWRDRYLKKVRQQNRSITGQVSLEADLADQADESNAVQPQADAPAQRPLKRQSPPSQGSRKRPRTADGTPEAPERSVGEPRLPLSPIRVKQAIMDHRMPRNNGPLPTPLSPSRNHRVSSTVPTANSHSARPPTLSPERSPRRKPLSTRHPSETVSSPREPREPRNTSAPPKKDPDTEPNELPETYPLNFSPQHYEILFRTTPAILDTDSEHLGTAFDKVAETYSTLGRTGKDWRIFWQNYVLPRYCQQFSVDIKTLDPEARIPSVWSIRRIPKSKDEAPPDIECAQCYIKESVHWRHDKQGRTLCDGCGSLLKQARFRSLSGALSELPEEVEESQEQSDAGNEDVASLQKKAAVVPATVHTHLYSDACVQTSPILEPQDASIKQEEGNHEHAPDPRPPGPNEARKRSTGKSSQSNSQETAASQETSNVMAQAIEGATEEPSSPREPSSSAWETKRVNTGEIETPPTPEHIQAPVGSFSAHDVPDSPLFVPQDSENEPILPSPRQSSPLNLQFFENESPSKILSSFSQRNRRARSPASESGYNFETAPSMSQYWETAPQSPQRSERRLSTQALFEQPTLAAESSEFDLPEPDGGWELLGIPEPTPSEINLDDEEDQVDANVDRDASALEAAPGPDVMSIDSSPSAPGEVDEEPPAISLWLADQRDLYPPSTIRAIVLEHLLSIAIEATSFDFALAAYIIPAMISASKTEDGRRCRREGQWKRLLPKAEKGVWTERDDRSLAGDPDDMGVNGGEMARLQKKHGEGGVQARREFLRAYAEA